MVLSKIIIRIVCAISAFVIYIIKLLLFKRVYLANIFWCYFIYIILQSPNLQFKYQTSKMQQNQTKKFSYLDEFKIVQTLGSGYHAQVKLGMDQKGNLFAIKRYKKETANLKTLQHELNVMKVLHHQNLVRLIDVRDNATYKRKDETSYKCFAIILEYVGGGELFDFVAETGKFSEKVARSYFNQMMNGLYYMHCKGFAHRDIKPQNILLARDFTLKLADFGFACLWKGKDGTGILHTKLGTQGYMAPEIPTKNYKGTKVDIFAAGVILFIMFAGNPPFEKAHSNDPYYRLIKQKNYVTFWKAHSRNRPQGFFTQSFKDLFIKMVSYESDERPTIQQIAGHPWVKGPVCTQSQIREEFELRKKRLDIIMSKKRQEQQHQKQAAQRNVHILGQSRGETQQVDERFLEIYESQIQKNRPPRQLYPKNTDDFTVDQNISYASALLKYYLQNKRIYIDEQQFLSEDPKILKLVKFEDNNNSFNASFQLCYTVQRSSFTQNIEISVELGQTFDNKITVCLQHISGNRFYYKKIAKQIRGLFAYCQNQNQNQN